jgi:hypothetical protein
MCDGRAVKVPSAVTRSTGPDAIEAPPTQSSTFFADPEFRPQGVKRRAWAHPASYNPACRGVPRATAAKGELFHDYRRHSPTLLD